MKASNQNIIRLLVVVQTDFEPYKTIPAGTYGTIMECYINPTEAYAVDLALKDESLVGDYSYENVILSPEQFEVVPSYPPTKK